MTKFFEQFVNTLMTPEEWSVGCVIAVGVAFLAAYCLLLESALLDAGL